MSLVNTKDMLCNARTGGYAVGAFNIFNMESAKAIISAAELENAPVILQIWSGFDAFIGIDTLAGIAIAEAKKAKVPVAVHLDHGATLSQVGSSVRYGLTSVMLDGSALSVEENISITKQVVDFCKDIHVPVEGEIGHVGGSEGGEGGDPIVYTDPDEAKYFAEQTGVNSLAISIGTFHGTYENPPQLDIDLLKKIADKVDIPLVLHGSSFTPDEMIKDAVTNGISKINVATEIGDRLIETTLSHVKSIDKAKYSNELTDIPYKEVTNLVRHKICLFGSSNKA